MALKVICPSCRTSYQLADSVAGHKVRCKACQHVFRVEAANPPPPASSAGRNPDIAIRKGKPAAVTPAPVLQPRRDDDEDDDRDRPRRRRGEKSKSNALAWIMGGVG